MILTSLSKQGIYNFFNQYQKLLPKNRFGPFDLIIGPSSETHFPTITYIDIVSSLSKKMDWRPFELFPEDQIY